MSKASDEGPYPVAARVIWLYLEEFCEEGMTVPDMIAEAARRANREIESLRAALLAGRRENARAIESFERIKDIAHSCDSPEAMCGALDIIDNITRAAIAEMSSGGS